ncbi:hypothetical protein MTBLM1_20373 [Rhodospirillaceae bacterium LM-1]|nr:hypothetical protein MTBLM1_20373 [Rhodospirillaceae bacterium LM-1]
MEVGGWGVGRLPHAYPEGVLTWGRRQTRRNLLKSLVPQAGLEPARSCLQQILSLPRLPFRHWGTGRFGRRRRS